MKNIESQAIEILELPKICPECTKKLLTPRSFYEIEQKISRNTVKVVVSLIVLFVVCLAQLAAFDRVSFFWGIAIISAVLGHLAGLMVPKPTNIKIAEMTCRECGWNCCYYVKPYSTKSEMLDRAGVESERMGSQIQEK